MRCTWRFYSRMPGDRFRLKFPSNNRLTIALASLFAGGDAMEFRDGLGKAPPFHKRFLMIFTGLTKDGDIRQLPKAN